MRSWRENASGQPTFLDLVAAPTAEAEVAAARFQQAFSWLRRPEFISVAAIRDLRIAADDAELAMAETSLGLVPDLGGTASLPALVGYSRALEICVTGRSVDAAEAERIGLVNEVVPIAELDRAVRDLVRRLLSPPRAAVTETKALLVDAARREAGEQLLAERQAQLRCLRRLAEIT